MTKSVFVKGGTEFHVTKVGAEQVNPKLQDAGSYKEFWHATCARPITADHKNATWTLARGHSAGRREIVVWYPNGRMWVSYGETIKAALEGAADEAFKYI